MRRTSSPFCFSAALLVALAFAAPARAQMMPMGAGDPSQTPTLGGGQGTPRPRNPDDEAPPPRAAFEAPTVAVPEGNQCTGPRVVAVRFQGLTRVSANDIRDSVRVREGQCFVRGALSRDAR